MRPAIPDLVSRPRTKAFWFSGALRDWLL